MKGKYGEPVHWDGFSTLFVLLARDATDLTATERKWLVALTSDETRGGIGWRAS